MGAGKILNGREAVRIAAFLLLGISFRAAISVAAPNEYGETGLVEQPMATTLTTRRSAVVLGMKYFDFIGESDFRAAPFGLAFGVSPNIEVGLSLSSYSATDMIFPGVEQSLRLMGKWRFLSDVDGWPALAVAVWGDNLFGVAGAGTRIIAQKQIDGFQIMMSGGYLYLPDRSFALGGIGFERELVDGIDIVLDVNYAYPSDPDGLQRLRGYPGVRWFITPKIAIIGSVGGGLDGDETVLEGFAGISFTSHEGRKIRRAKADIPGVEQLPEVAPPPPEEEQYPTPRPQFKLRIPPAQLQNSVTS